MTYKGKFRWLIIGSVLFLFIAYHLSIKKTLTLMHDNTVKSERLSIVNNAPQRIAKLKGTLNMLNKQIGTNINEDIDYQEMLLEYISNYCKEKNLVLSSMGETHSYQNGDYLVQTNVFTIEGQFVKLLKLIYFLEENNKSGKIIGLDFFSKEDFIQKKRRLFVTLYFQNIKQKQSL